jgi:hypothetical protein
LYASANLETTGLKLFFLDAQASFDQQFMSRSQAREIIIIAKNKRFERVISRKFQGLKTFRRKRSSVAGIGSPGAGIGS